MHMADALLSAPVAVTMCAASAGVAGLSVIKLKKEGEKKLPQMAVLSALVFAGQMINYTIPGTGASGHICGAMLLTALLGPWAGFLSMVAVLAVQCLFFADGGLLALGANIWNMAFYGCFFGYYLIYRPIMRGKIFNSNARLKIIFSSVLGCILSLQLGAFSVVLETMISGVTELTFGTFVLLMQPIHLAIGLVEGLITAAVLVFVYQARPELLQCVKDSGNSKMSLKSVLIILGILAIVIGGGLSILASSNPDGLEWALFSAGVDETASSSIGVLPDYSIAGSESAAGTSISGVVGIAIIVALAVVAGIIASLLRKKRIHD